MTVAGGLHNVPPSTLRDKLRIRGIEVPKTVFGRAKSYSPEDLEAAIEDVRHGENNLQMCACQVGQLGTEHGIMKLIYRRGHHTGIA